MEKVHKILADCGLGSRRRMEEWLVAGRVFVNNELATVATRARRKDKIEVDGKIIKTTKAARRLLMYHKPKGKWVTREEGVESVFADLPLVEGGRWLNIGRLDVNTEGLLLFSTDGELAHRLAHPSHGKEREYRARVNRALPESTVERIQQKGVVFDDGVHVRPLLFKMDRSGEGVNCWYHIIVSEGRNRVIRRIFEKYDILVSRLLRVRFGEHKLPANLQAGEWREITTTV